MCFPFSSFSWVFNGSNCSLCVLFLLLHHRDIGLFFFLFLFFVISSQQEFVFHLWSAALLTAVSLTTQLQLILYLHLGFCLPKWWTIHLSFVNFVSLISYYSFNLSRTIEFQSFLFFQSAFKFFSSASSTNFISLFFILLFKFLMRLF